MFFLPSVFSIAPGKEFVCRVPEEIHSANVKTLGKFDVSGMMHYSYKFLNFVDCIQQKQKLLNFIIKYKRTGLASLLTDNA